MPLAGIIPARGRSTEVLNLLPLKSPLKPMPMLVFGVLLLLAAPSNAVPFSTNDRSSLLTEGSTSAETSLADILIAEGNYTGGFAAEDQSIDALFSPVGETVTTELIVEIADGSRDNILGIYDQEGHELILFHGSADDGDSVALTFDSGAVTSIRNGRARTSTTAEFGTTFGFFIRNDEVGFTYYSQDILNPGERAHFAAFEDADALYFGFEDNDLGDRDYNDLVARVRGLTGGGAGPHMPEPNSALLFALGAGTLYHAARRRRAG